MPRLHILAIDDESVNLRVVERRLHRMHMTCETLQVPTGVWEWLVAAGQLPLTAGPPPGTFPPAPPHAHAVRPFDAIFMDINMSPVDGANLSRDLLAAGLRIPIFPMTANANVSDRERYAAAGMHRFVIVKPFNSAALTEALDHIVRRT